MARAISRFVSPCHTKSATWSSFAVSRSRGCMICLLLHKHCGRKLHALAAVSNSRPQEERAQVLFHRSWADGPAASRPGTVPNEGCSNKATIKITHRDEHGSSSL